MSAISTSTPLTVSKPGGLTRLDRTLICLLAVCTFALYARTSGFGFVRFDDQEYVSNNLHVLSGLSLDSLRWAMTATVVGNWHPLTLLTELLLVSLFGPGARAFHLTNALLHTLNVALLYLFLRKSTGRPWPALFTAAMWGLHPLREESVAWVSELKDVLCGTFWLLCMLAYLRYSQRRTIGNYFVVFALQALALLAKPMAVTLPAVLLLMDFWPLGGSDPLAPRRWGNRIAEKLPLAALCIADIAYAFRTQQIPALIFALCTPAVRFKNAPIACVEYLRDIFFPYHLGVFYPHPAMLGHSISIATSLLAAALLLVITLLVFLRIRSAPYLAVGWLWFLGTLIPVIGLVQVGAQSHADRYTYLPSIGITFAVVWLISDLCAGRRMWQTAAAALATLVTAALVIAVSCTLGRWATSRTLFTDLRRLQPDNYLALCFYSDDLLREGHINQALKIAKEVVSIAPLRPEPHASYAAALKSAGELPQASEQFRAALSRDRANPYFWDGLGSVREEQANLAGKNRDPAEQKFRQTAIDDFQTAVDDDPDFAIAREQLAVQLARVGKLDDAIAQWQQAVQLKPDYAQAQGDLADGLRLRGDLPGAVEHYRAALADGSKNPGWETNLAWLVATSPQATPADVQPMIAYAKDACDQTGNQQVAPLDAYAACLARVGRIDSAVSAAQQAIAQANAAKDPKLAQAIQRRMDRYARGLSYVAGDDRPATNPTSKPASTRSGKPSAE